ncbi:MAG: DUF167 domain-containing protein [Chthoniobacteraceae bacterium]
MPATLSLQITANARRNEIVGWLGDRLKVKVHAPAVDGKANRELLEFLAETLGVKPGDLEITHGAHAKSKTIRVQSLDEKILREKLATLVQPPPPLLNLRQA